MLGVGTFFYAGLEGLEGIGLLLRRRWAEYLTVVATGLLLPLEFYEIARKPTGLRVAVLLANLAVLAYLIVKLIQRIGLEAPRLGYASSPGLVSRRGLTSVES